MAYIANPKMYNDTTLNEIWKASFEDGHILRLMVQSKIHHRRRRLQRRRTNANLTSAYVIILFLFFFGFVFATRFHAHQNNRVVHMAIVNNTPKDQCYGDVATLINMYLLYLRIINAMRNWAVEWR